MKKKTKHLIAWLLLFAMLCAAVMPHTASATETEQEPVTTTQPVMPEGMEDYLKPASDDDSEAGELQWYLNNRAVLSNHDIVVDVLRWLGWEATKLLCSLANVTETLYDKTFGLIDLTQYEQVEQLLTRLRPVLAALIVLCLMGLGATLMVKQEKMPLVRNILLGLFAVSCSAWLFTTANGLVASFKDGILGGENANQSYALVNDNIIDLVRADKAGWIEDMDYRSGSGLHYGVGADSQDDLRMVNITETLDWHSKKNGMDRYGWSADFNNRIKFRVQSDGNGGWIAVKNSDGLTSANIGNQFYYRYSFDFFSCALQLISLALIFCALSYKNVRIAYELVVSRILAYMYAADVGGGERLKNILIFIRDTYITLAVSVLCVKLYAVFTGAITSMGVNGLGKGLVSLFIAFAVIDGPNLVERLLGMDAGLQSSFARGAAMLGAAKGITRGAAGIAKGVTGAVKGRQHIAAQRQNAGGAFSAAAASQGGQRGDGMDAGFMSGGSDRQRGSGNSGSGNSGSGSTSQSGRSSASQSAGAASESGGAPTATDAERTPDNSGGSDRTPDFSPTAAPQPTQQRVSNPAFRDAVRRLAPDKTAGAQERKDYNRQVNAIVRGKQHRAIRPDADAPDYQKRNYDKALALEQAYRAYKPKQPPVSAADGSMEAPSAAGETPMSGSDRTPDFSATTAAQASVTTESGADTAFMDGGGADNRTPDFSATAAPQQTQRRVVNPAFRDAVKRLTPGVTASAQERKDYNRQVNAIVRGKKHRAIRPDADAPDYRKRNYDKALELEQAYRAYKPEQQNGGGDEDVR